MANNPAEGYPDDFLEQILAIPAYSGLAGGDGSSSDNSQLTGAGQLGSGAGVIQQPFFPLGLSLDNGQHERVSVNMGSLYPAFEHLQPQSIRHNVPQIHQVFQDKQLLAQQSLCHTRLACVQECVLGEDKRRIPIVLLNGPVQSVKKSYIDAYLFVRVNEQPVSNLLQALLLKPSICDMPCNKSARKNF